MIARKLIPLLTSVPAAVLLASCSVVSDEPQPSPVADLIASADYAPEIPDATGYFASDSDLPFHAPDFTQISESDYLPAFDQGMEIQTAEVQAIILSLIHI